MPQRWHFLGATSLALLAGLLAGCPRPRPVAPPAPTGPVKLAVLVYFDQMRGDYLARWRELYVEGGLRRLCDEGAWFQNCHYPYANTLTGPGHASVAAGCSADVHGIVANDWYDERVGKEVNCVGDDRYPQVPPAAGSKPKGVAPTRLRAPTIGDALKRATKGKGKVVAVSWKDRSAVLPAGQKGDAVYWVTEEGQVVTSAFYRDGLHPWAKALNKSALVERWRKKSWERLRADVDYAKWSGPDDGPGEGGGKRQGRTFPHPFEGKPRRAKDKVEKKDYYTAVGTSPAGNEVVFEMLKRALSAERLGTRDVPDLLSVSFSSNDLVGHAWGPDSQEVLDVTLRSDLIVKELLALLDEKVGEGKYAVVLTADHGICPLPEARKAKGLDGGRVEVKDLKKAADEHLAAALATEKGKPVGGWVASLSGNMFYLDRRKVKAKGHTVEEVAARLAAWAVKQPGIQAAYTRKALEGAKNDPVAETWRLSFHPTECGDVMLVMRPGWYFTDKVKTGTTHGSPHEYDTHVPLVVYGPGVKAGARTERVTPQAAAAILARALGIDPPAKAAAGVPAGLFEGE